RVSIPAYRPWQGCRLLTPDTVNSNRWMRQRRLRTTRHSGEDRMYDRKTWSRLARLKARKIYEEMQAEGLDRSDLPRKLREVAEREEAAVQRFVAEYGVDSIDARLLLQ